MEAAAVSCAGVSLNQELKGQRSGCIEGDRAVAGAIMFDDITAFMEAHGI
jgi:hypothetical protein